MLRTTSALSRSMKPLDMALALFVVAIWGMGFVVAKAAIGHFPPILLLALRFTVTALVLIWFFPMPRTHLLKICGIALVVASIQYSLTYTGLKDMDASTTMLIFQLQVP